MTYKERYYRDHKNDKKPLSTRLIELGVEVLGTLAYLMIILCIVVGIGKQPIVWWVTFISQSASVVVGMQLEVTNEPRNKDV